MMWEEEVLPRALQNHLLQARHRTTELGLWIPQYLRSSTLVMTVNFPKCDTHAHACGGSSFSSSALTACFPLAPSMATLAMLSVSSSSNASVPSSSSSCRRLRGPPDRFPLPYSRSKMLSSASMVDRSSPALIVGAESDIRWLPKCVKAPSMLWLRLHRGVVRCKSMCEPGRPTLTKKACELALRGNTLLGWKMTTPST